MRFFSALASFPAEVRRRLKFLLGALIAFNVIVWVFTFAVSRSYPLLFGLAALAYGFGLRHAVDADHIAAIDNTTRKLMRDGQRPVATGFFFSLGHSTIVIALSVFIAFSASFIQHNLPALRDAGSLIGTTASSLFLIAVGIINLIALVDIVQTWRRMVRARSESRGRGERSGDGGPALTPGIGGGIMARILRPVMKMIDHSWKMFPVGLLFGLGFDTASEVGLLSISAAVGVSGIPLWSILLLPLVFTAGMALVDSLDGMLMLGAYGWAYVKPMRKLYYNMNITLISVFTALFIGGIEGLQLLGAQLHADAGIFALANNIPLENFGYIVIFAFLLSWAASTAFYRLKRYDLLDVPEQRGDERRKAL